MSKYKVNKFVVKKIEKSDYKYNSLIVSKMINRIMQDGKKSVASKIVYSAIERLSTSTRVNFRAGDSESTALDLFKLAVDNIVPPVELKSRRIGGATYQVPIPLSEKRGEFFALKWLHEAAIEKKGKNFDVALTEAMEDSCNLVGSAIKRKNDNISRAKDNQAFGHYRW